MRIDKLFLKQVGPFENAMISLPAGTNPDLAVVYLLTGPNGSGKSTALYALAGMIGCGHGNLGSDHGSRRLRSADSVAAFVADGCHRAMAWRRIGTEHRPLIPDPFNGGDLQYFSGQGPIVGYYQSSGDHPIHKYSELSNNFALDIPVDARPKFSWAAFAYAGMRSVSDAQVIAIQEPTYSPFENSLSFINTANTERLAQWIANQQFRRLKAKEAGHLERANQLERSILDIERVVAEIIGEEFAFVTSEEDNNVRVRRNGVVIDLGLLPDGLKSIVSWIADLLMRLDRIPWIDETPPLQRSFLLLLDEVDIHLHPSWQRKVLPIVQRMFPKAQIIASTHSPFVVASVEDAHIITLSADNGVARVEQVVPSQTGVSYSAVLRSIFGIESEFDIETEHEFQAFHQAKQELLSGAANDRAKVQQLADALAKRGEEVAQLIGIELRQLERQIAHRGAV